ncbi:MAG: Type II secretion system protein E [Betaproteobacteria bacterium ADurb.Bin341]|nr:MAG: Type II secretion system protein E [Betaproteobacteria bacterium ADurb.Bin341]
MFPEGFYNEINAIAQVLSYDGHNEPDILAMVAASAALTISGVPFMGPIGAARVGYLNGEYILNPTDEQVAEGDLDLVVAATYDAVMMVESEANELSEEVMLGAVLFAHDACKEVVKAIVKLAEQAAKDPWEVAAGDDNAAIKDKLASRIKVISRLNIAEKRVPQDGRMRLVMSKTRAIDFRVSTLPTLQGEKIVCRILDPSSATLGIDALGYEPEQRQALLDAVERPYGMVLVTGPTGSGKTVSLYTCLNLLNKPGINISTAEDPAEINLPGINQVNVDDKAGLTFPIALKAFLRQDPDIIMVGEIRDLETAEISVKAAQTGHLVLSTLHTNDAPQTLTRLMNMGIPTFNIASSVLLITAQRLARRLCTCKQLIDVPPETLLNAGYSEEDLDGSWQLYGPGGCERCKGSGYKGRVGIYQVMPNSDAIQRIIMAGGNSIDIAEQAKREGVKDLRQSGLLKVKQGVTSLDEVLSTTNL